MATIFKSETGPVDQDVIVDTWVESGIPVEEAIKKVKELNNSRDVHEVENICYNYYSLDYTEKEFYE